MAENNTAQCVQLPALNLPSLEIHGHVTLMLLLGQRVLTPKVVTAKENYTANLSNSMAFVALFTNPI